jgi:hypothetical protein
MAEEKNIEQMSDEEIENMEPPEITPDEAPEENTSAEENNTQVSSPEAFSASPSGFGSETDEETKAAEEQPAPQIDYEGFYKTVMSPIKANGKMFQPRDAQEAIRLMQMGVDYTRKMQHLAPVRRQVQMLRQANLLGDEKLNYLIDLANGSPEAIKKLLKDHKIDPLDMDMESEPKYTPSNHSVSNEEMLVQSVVDDLRSTPEGTETLKLFETWDQASLQELWKDPSLMTTLNEQRQNGVYDLITKEMEHQRILDHIPPGTPFLQAYKAVGDYCLRKQQEMRQMNLPKGTIQKPVDSAAAQVKAAAPTGRSTKAAQTFIDPFSLSDEDFEKTFKNYSL